jgi:hypothetical protein
MKYLSKLAILLFSVIFSTQLVGQNPGGVSGNLELWLKANAGVTLSGADVTTWADQAIATDNADPMTQGITANQPDMVLSALNFNPAVDFDGTDDFLSGSAVLTMGDDDFTYIVVWKSDALKTAAIIEQNSNTVVIGSRAALATTVGGDFGFAGEGNDAFPSTYNATQYQITTLIVDGAADVTSIKNGVSLNGSINITTQNTSVDTFAIARKHSSATEYFDGKIAEVIVYSGAISPTDRRKIESYLSVKYGISLDQTTATNYTSALGTDIWNATNNSGYNTDITGVGRDDLSGLAQTKSKNENSSAVLTIANGSIASPTSFGATESWLIWGSNGASTTFSTTVNNVTSGSSPRMARVWKVQETGTVGLVEVSFSNSLSTGITSLIIHSSDPTLPNNGSRSVYEMENDGTNFRVKVNLNSGDYFTFAQGKIAADPDVIINEIVSTPRQDWSGGGFYNIAHGGTEDNSDGWVELYINKAGLDLTNYTFEFEDVDEVVGSLLAGGAFEVSNYYSKTGGLFKRTKVGDYLVLGNPIGAEVIDPTVIVRYYIRDGNSKIIDQVTVHTGEGTGFDGNSTTTTNESISRIPNGKDTNVSSIDFKKTKASIGGTNSPTGIVKINEVVPNPQQDWNSISFNGSAPGGMASSNDEWVELYIGSDGINLTGWQISLIDGTNVLGDLSSVGAFQVSNYISAVSGTFNNTKSGDYLVLGNVSGGAMNNDVLVVLKDASGTEIDRVQLGGAAGQAPSANSATINTESISRYVNAKDTNTDNIDFIRTIASLGKSNSPTGIVKINEVITDPQQDWSTNSFNGIVSSSTVSEVDEWIELYIGTAGMNLTGWSILAIDSDSIVGSLSAGGAFDESVYTGAGSFFNTQVGDYLVLGNPQSIKSMNNTMLTVQIKDAFGTLIDQVKIGGAAGEAPTGNATSRANEAVARIPNGVDTNTDNVDFVKVNATLGKANSTSLIDLARNALQFDGVDDFISIPTNASINFLSAGMAVEYWIKTIAINAWPLAKGSGGTANEYFFQIDGSGFIKFGGHQTDNTERSSGFSTSAINDNTWHHIAGVYTGTNFQIYVDGKLQNQAASVGTLKTDQGILQIGKQVTGDHFVGLLDELRIWKTSRTHEQVLENMFTTADQNLTTLLGAYYRFDQTSGITLPDIVTNSNNDGTLTNMAGTEWTAANWPIFSDNQATFQSLSVDVTSAPSSNLTVSGNAFLLDDNDILLIGHDNIDFTEVTTDLPANTLVASRFGRTWHLYKNDVVGTVNGDLTFSFNLGSVPDSKIDFYLLERTGTTGAFSIVPVKGINPSGNNILFTVNASQLDNGSYYTLGKSTGGPGNALAFDGVDDIVEMDGSLFPSFSAVTIEAWVYWTGESTDIDFITSRNGEGLEIHTAAASTSNSIRFIPTTQVLIDTDVNTFMPNTWNHIACVYNPASSLVAIYINGIAQNTIKNGTNPITTAITATSDNFRLGARTLNQLHFSGYLDEVRVWNTARTHNQIVEGMSTSLAGTESNLVAYYRFNQGRGNNDTNLPDLSGDLNSGVLSNFNNLNSLASTSNYIASTRTLINNNTLIVNGGVNTNSSDELTISSSQTAGNFIQDARDQIIWGNDGGAFHEAVTDLPTGTLVTNRIAKIWRVSKNDEIGTAHGRMTFSFNLGSVPNPDFTYYLLTRAGTSGNFSVIKTIGSKPSGNSIEFTIDGEQVTTNNYFTLGRSNAGSGNVLDFDGVDDLVQMDGTLFPSINAVTIEAWVYWTGGSTDVDFITSRNGEGLEIHTSAPSKSNSIRFIPTTQVFIDTDANTFMTNVWNHIACVYDPTSSLVAIYVNGIVQNTTKNGTNPITTPITSTSDNFRLGTRITNTNYFSGTLDEVRIWSDVRTKTEILENLYKSLDVANETNLVAYYKFNQGIAAGTNTGVDLLTDYSGNNFAGTITNFALFASASNWVASTAVVTDKVSAPTLAGPGNALDFDGADDYVDLVLPLVSPSTFTVEAWINAASFATGGSANRILAIDKGSYTTNNPFALFVNDAGKVGYVLGTGDANNDFQNPLTFSPTLAINTWYHVALSFDGTVKRLYIDGILQGQVTNTGTFTNTNTEQLLTGDMATHTPNDGEWEGQIDEVRIWSTARTASEIQNNMYEELLGTEAGLVAYYRFDEISGSTTLPDVSSNSNTGTLTNMDAASDWVSAAVREPFKTTNAGTWESASTWKSRTVPNLASSKISVRHALTVSSNLTANDILVAPGGSIALAASQTLTSTGDLINNGSITGAGTVNFTGTAPQIGGNSVPNMKLTTTSGRLFTDFEVTGNLDLSSNSKLDIRENNLTINTVSNVGSSAYIVTKNLLTSTGFVKKNLSQANGNFVFPVGTSNYTPVSIVNLGTTGVVNARVFNNTYKAGTSGDVVTTEKEVNKSWEIKADAGVNVTITLQWNATDEDANYTAARSVAYMSKNDYKWWLPITPQVGATGGGPYQITASGVTSFSVFGSGADISTLPVTWLDFIGAENKFGEVVLDWSTVAEKHNDKFEIERSIDGKNFEELGVIQGSGTTTVISKYRYIDQFPIKGLGYYRIKQIDFDGKHDYSEMLAIKLGSGQLLTMEVFPNRTFGKVNLRVGGTPGVYQLMVMDMMGRTYGRFELTENAPQFDITSFPAGIYIFKVANAQGTLVRRVIKQ